MCGIHAILTTTPATDTYARTVRGLHDLQHRGQKGYGVSYVTPSSSHAIHTRTFDGLVPSVADDDPTRHPSTRAAIGHVRYPTSGSALPTSQQPLQPFQHTHPTLGEYAICHNGHIAKLDSEGDTDETDTQKLVAWLHAHTDVSDWVEMLLRVLAHLPNAYCLLVLTADSVYAVRDAQGVRPLCIGWADEVSNEDGDDAHGESADVVVTAGRVAISSETCALYDKGYTIDTVSVASVVRCRWVSDTRGIVCSRHTRASSLVPTAQHCLFEHIYFAKATSVLDGSDTATFRQACGAQLWDDEPPTQRHAFLTSRTVVCGSPNSGLAAGKGYARRSGLPYAQVLIKNPLYTKQRTFILQTDHERKSACRQKFLIAPTLQNTLRGAIVVLVDDSIVRGNTMGAIVSKFFDGGAREVHVRVASPPVQDTCHKGIDIPTSTELLAVQVGTAEQHAGDEHAGNEHAGDEHASNNLLTVQTGVKQHIRATSVRYLTRAQMRVLHVSSGGSGGICTACFGCGA